ncbi:MAG: Na(+)-translocating NADH-quinone reductase subunit C [Pseudomonadota bacterium]
MSSNDSIQKTLVVALALCVVCSVIVSTAAVVLKPAQEVNKTLDRKRNILAAAGMLEPSVPVDEQFKQITTKVVDLDTGRFTDAVDPADYDQRRAAKDPSLSEVIPAAEDKAKISRRERYALVYLVEGPTGNLEKIILPVHGYGLWSTLYGFIALEADANTIAGLGFYEHGETPGLGGEVDNPRWKALWPGKQVYRDGQVQIALVKGAVNPQDAEAPWEVDGLAGATLTARGVTNLVQYWLGENGFEPFLDNLVTGEA